MTKILRAAVGVLIALTLGTAFVLPPVFAADAPAPSDAVYFAVKADANMAFTFQANGGSKSHPTQLYLTPGNGISSRSAEGWYIEKIAGFDYTKMRELCAEVLQPKVLRYQVACTPWGSKPLPADHIFRLKFTPE